jgi:hydroxymethylpyrimidine kinase/phosphomethylpyrimidine kinase
MTAARIPNVLTVAGSDPSGGAGIQADLKTFSARRCYGMAAITALTAQNTRGVAGVHLVPPAFVQQQLAAIFADVRVDAVKIGMIATADIALAVADALEAQSSVPTVLDPVMIAKGGAALLHDDAIDAVRARLVPRATVITPNLPEAARLLDVPVATTREEMVAQANALLALGPAAVLLKGGHLEGGECPDCLVTAQAVHWFESPRVQTTHTHGTGCTLAAAITAELAHGAALPEAIHASKTYVTAAITAAHQLTVGHGHGPTHHFHALWQD